MIDRLANRFGYWLFRKNAIKIDKIEGCIYGTSTLISTLVNTLGLIVIGSAFQQTGESLIILCIFYINQSIGGGYHANNRAQCFSVMMIGMILCLAFCRIELQAWISYSAISISTVVLFLIPVVLHPNKFYLEKKKETIVRRSRIITIFITMIAIICSCFPNNLLKPYSLGINASAISRIIGYIKRKQR